MECKEVHLDEFYLIGIDCYTSNALEKDPLNGSIFPCIRRYFHEKLFEKILNRKNPGVTYCVYTEYEKDHTGMYTYFIGEKVNSIEDLPEGFKSLHIPSQRYAKFTAGPGSMPDVVAKPWQAIWVMTPEEIGGDRSYIADFEIYDERASDHNNIILDIYVGLKPQK